MLSLPFLLDLGSRVLQGDRAVEDELAGPAVGIDAETAESLELVASQRYDYCYR
jgi:hypothetical protein